VLFGVAVINISADDYRALRERGSATPTTQQLNLNGEWDLGSTRVASWNGRLTQFWAGILNHLGNEGWELVGTTPGLQFGSTGATGVLDTSFFFLLKRQQPE